jgi:deazaflavin-dependent oxidoreductase (nitroreductase family)
MWVVTPSERPGRIWETRDVRDRESIQRWNEDIIAEFRANDGKVGGKFEGAPMLLLHTIGARSGAVRINPMMYLPDGDRMIVIASKWGSPGNPDWYHNLTAHPDVSVEVGTDTIAVSAVELDGHERDRMFDEQARRYPGFQIFQDRTERVIPVIALNPRAAQ